MGLPFLSPQLAVHPDLVVNVSPDTGLQAFRPAQPLATSEGTQCQGYLSAPLPRPSLHYFSAF